MHIYAHMDELLSYSTYRYSLFALARPRRLSFSVPLNYYHCHYSYTDTTSKYRAILYIYLYTYLPSSRFGSVYIYPCHLWMQPTGSREWHATKKVESRSFELIAYQYARPRNTYSARFGVCLHCTVLLTINTVVVQYDSMIVCRHIEPLIQISYFVFSQWLFPHIDREINVLWPHQREIDHCLWANHARVATTNEWKR